jgi:phenylpropionate dioxygenase-like ring-hydroxylating dioxygenase large terminal subunit
MTSTYPWPWYSDEAVLRAERERIFRSAWHYVGHRGRLPEPSTYFASSSGGVPAVIVRDAEGELGAFLNVCRHRGAVIVSGEGRRETLQCPYHAWTYGLDGELRAAPRSQREPGFDLDGLSLLPLRLEAWGPFLFVNADPAAPPLAEALHGLSVAIDPETLVFRERVHYELAANWKIAVENYLECYHCSVAHPAFSRLVNVDPDVFALDGQGPLWSQRSRTREGDGRCEFHLVWPGLKLNVYPGPANLSIGPVWPEGTSRTVGFLDYFFGPEVDNETARELIAFDDQVGREDAALVEAVQRGVGAGLLGQGRLLPDSERLIVSFQRRVVEALTK